MTPDELRALADEAWPGPWSVEEFTHVVVPHPVWENERVMVAQTHDVRRSTSDADARLIALAPDLARLCAELGEALDDISRTSASSSEGMCQNMARTALAKLSELEAG